MARRPVLIVGGGPVGLYASVLLSRAGVPSVLLERAARGPAHPRAHLINTRSMELLREVGLEPRVRALGPPMREWREFRYCHSLLGRQIATEDHMAKPEWATLRAASATTVAHVSQPGLEALLREEAERLAPAASSKLLFGHECAVFDQPKGSGVRVEVRREGGGAASPMLELEGSALLACDGAHSRMRRALGLQLSGPPPLQHFKSVHFRAPSLHARLGHRPAMLYFVFHEEAVAVLVAHHMREGEWVAQLPFFPPLQDGSHLDEAECARVVEALIGEPVPDLQICSAGSWRMVAAVAQRMSAGCVHLLGDAAHQFPPAGAFGMNTGLQDAHNLCWKLAAVHHGHADEALLASYDAERRPVAHANARLAVHNYERGLRVAEALGLPSSAPQGAADAMEAMRGAAPGALAALLASPRVKAGTGAAVDAVRSRLLKSLGNQASAGTEAGREGVGVGGVGGAVGGPISAGVSRLDAARVERAAAVVAAGRALPLLFPRHELGFIYDGPRAATLGPEDAGGRGSTGGGSGAARRRVLGLDETEEQVEDETLLLGGALGSRLPHHWLRTDAGARVSSLDLLGGQGAAEAVSAAAPSAEGDEEAGAGGSSSAPTSPAPPPLSPPSPPCFTLLVDGADSGHWGGGAALLPPGTPLRVIAVAVGVAQGAAAGGGGSHAAGGPAAAGGVRLARVVDSDGGWAAKVCAAGPCAALLVRPDGHVAWRGESAAAEGVASSSDAAERLQGVLDRILRRH